MSRDATRANVPPYLRASVSCRTYYISDAHCACRQGKETKTNWHALALVYVYVLQSGRDREGKGPFLIILDDAQPAELSQRRRTTDRYVR